jgi:hypothetical protein
LIASETATTAGRDQRSAQAVGDRRPENRAVGVGRLLPEEDEVCRLALERRGEGAARRNEIRACSRFVRDEHGAVDAHGKGLAERLRGLRRPERDGDHLAFAARLLEPQRLLDGVRVEAVEGRLAGAVEAPGRRIDALRGSLRNLLDADRDLHRSPL